MRYLFDPPSPSAVPLAGGGARFPVHRIYCVGKNYAAHVIEMGGTPERQPPCFFMKPADALTTAGALPYPTRTRDFHYEGELVIAIGKDGADIPAAQALEHVFGYAIGLDMTRRDLQREAVARAQPWDVAKGFDASAPLSPIVPVQDCGHFERGRLTLRVNGELRQDADFSELIWKNHEVIAELSTLYQLRRGDLIFTGTPAGVGAVRPGDRIEVEIERLGKLVVDIVPRVPGEGG